MNRTIIATFGGLLILGCALCDQSYCQDQGAGKIVAAIKKMESSEQAVFAGKIETPPNKGLGGGAGGAIIIGGGSMSAQPFTEDFELVIRPREHDMLLCSTKALPGLVVYSDGEDTITSSTFRDDEFTASELSSDLSQLLELSNLQKYVERAENVKTENGKAYTCDLSKRLIRSSGGSALMAPKIKRIESRFEVTSEGDIASIAFTVVRENAVARLLAGSGTKTARVDGKSLEKLDPEMREQIGSRFGADEKVTYVLNRKREVSPRSKSQLQAMRKLASENQ